MDLTKLQKLLKNPNIEVHGFQRHTKASELYVVTTFSFPKDKYAWEGFVPYFYRRTGLFIETDADLAAYLEKVYPLFRQQEVQRWVVAERKRWDTDLGGKEVTKGFFLALTNMKWNSVSYDLPKNPNWARRVQDIKELGYTLATDTRRQVKGKNENDTHLILLPLPVGTATGYESFSAELKRRIIDILGGVNAYELSSANRHGLLPDHKFPEIRWDERTRDEGLEGLTDQEIKEKFQLIDNQRNQQKREACRECFQTGKRGTVFGIAYYYNGDENWPSNVPKVGKRAEAGCIGCGWYDINEWRRNLSKALKRSR